MSIKKIRLFLLTRVGAKIVIIYYGARNKKEKYHGYLSAVYNNIFTIITDDGILKCFNIIDILTKTIQIYI